ncbi:hypothetical protein DMUE_2665 [Dictyocoela muelleri]|nr:hypothetical protein DMUE_2665 [Dictyocoela muelleri]
MIHGRVRYLQSQGQVELLIQTFTRFLEKHILEEELATNNKTNKKTWIKYISKVVYEYNLVKHSATINSPFSLFLGRSGLNPLIEQNIYPLDSIDKDYDCSI